MVERVIMHNSQPTIHLAERVGMLYAIIEVEEADCLSSFFLEPVMLMLIDDRLCVVGLRQIG